MDGTQNLNLNSTECIARANDIGGTLIRNVCSGAQAYVAWGSGDWAMAIVGTSIVLLVFGVFGALFYSASRY